MIAKLNDSSYYIGMDKVKDDSYDRLDNPDGITQLGLAENRVSFGRFDYIYIYTGFVLHLSFFDDCRCVLI